MKDIYYFAAYKDSGCLLGCDHLHRTLNSAVACISVAGGYVVAVEDQVLRELNEVEERQFQLAMYGTVYSAEKQSEGHEVVFVFRIKLRPQSS